MEPLSPISRKMRSSTRNLEKVVDAKSDSPRHDDTHFEGNACIFDQMGWPTFTFLVVVVTSCGGHVFDLEVQYMDNGQWTAVSN
jgi:hypothetical protein